MDNTMLEMKKIVIRIMKMRKQENNIRVKFEESTGSLSTCMHFIICRLLECDNRCTLGINICTEENAEQLKKMGFEVESLHNVFDNISGYIITVPNADWIYGNKQIL